MSEESLAFVTHEVPKILPNIRESTFCPFVPRHGKSICDRHFQKVKIWCSHFAHRDYLVSDAEVILAIHRGARASNLSRMFRKKHAIFCKAVSLMAPHPSFYKRQLSLPGIKSTHGVTYITLLLIPIHYIKNYFTNFQC